MKADILVFAAHPDDAELSCSGTILHHIANGYSVAIVDLTQGELGSRGTAETRKVEAANATKILNLSFRDNLGLADGFFLNDTPTKLKVIQAIRKYRPRIVLANSPKDRHPDHGRAALLVHEACFLSGLIKVETFDDAGKQQEPHRPKSLFHYVQDDYVEPDFVVDITPYWNQKKESILAYSTQFYNPDSNEPQTPISSLAFMQFLEARSRDFGRSIGVEYAEGFVKSRMFGVNDLFTLC